MRPRFSTTVRLFIGVWVGLLLCAGWVRAYAAGSQRLDGIVDDSIGRPIEGAEVRLKTADGHIAASTLTGKNGKFHLNAPPGNFEATITKAEFKPAALSVVVAAGKPSKPILLTM